MAIDLTVPDLESLHHRAGEKWAAHDADVLSATVAEMDFPLAPPVAEALHRAIDRHDLGYPGPARASLRRSFARFADRRLRWTVDEDQIVLVPDVMVGLVELCRTIAAPGEAVAFATPAYPPFFGALPHAGVKLVNVGLLADGSLDLDGLEAHWRQVSARSCWPAPTTDRSRAPAERTRGDRGAVRGARGVGARGRDPCAADAPGATHIPWLEVSDAARRWGVTVTSASKAFNLAALKAALIVTADPAARDLVARMPPLHEHAGLLGVIAAEAAFDDGDAWLDAVIAQLDANREQLTRELARELPNIAWRPPEATYLAWLDCAGLGLGDEPAEIFLAQGRVALGAASTTARPAPATSASTSPRVPSTCPKPWRAWRVPPPTGN